MKKIKKNFQKITGIALKKAALPSGMLEAIGSVLEGNETTHIVSLFPFEVLASTIAKSFSGKATAISFDDKDLVPSTGTLWRGVLKR